MMQADAPRSVLISGGGGNLGRKLIRHLDGQAWCRRIVAVDRNAAALEGVGTPSGKVETVPLDLRDEGLAAHVSGIDTIVHFAVLNPLPDSTWAEAAHSFDMTARLLLLARERGVRRFVFASSNHTVGALMATPDAAERRPSHLTTDMFAPGSRWDTPGGRIVGYAYGAGKIFSERLCLAAAVPGSLSTVAIRIGWCQAGENRPETLNAGGSPLVSDGAVETEGGAAELAWFRDMWLSNRDFEQLFERAIRAPTDGWPGPAIVVNGVSANAGMAWEIETARRWLGYRPKDNVRDHV